MSGPLPLRLDPYGLLGQEAPLRGTVSLQPMARLKEATQGLATHCASVELWFSTDASGMCMLYGNYSAKVIMTCQRCLGPADIELQGNLELALLRSEDESSLVNSEREFFQLDRDGKLSIRDLIEEELLLSLPLVPVHVDDADCDETMLIILKKNSTEGVIRSEQNPFAVLKRLKTNGSK